ncbi:unnamed protein product [Zymoseptoria tritici ST99CH_1E4]|uniref:chitinase n=1 Tax=Zymoseptoria tritici ST99CH_1E4 TaxID=1276532 RepID=A0A2H1G3L5_ZYMTR|nr:unnamed protein product [Zymoseptoria tritici ST99CH_1E4]
MPSFASLVLAATGLFAAATNAQFNAAAKTNVAIYWGQGPNQLRLLEHCKRPAVDIINIGFINQFPDQTGSYPGSNFGNACYANVYSDPKTGQPTKLYSQCPNIGPDIKACQQTYGKKILLSIGGAYPQNYYLKSDTSANAFADFLWKAFGPVQTGYTGPRPFGDAVVDGFDFDIESYISPAPSGVSDYQTRGYISMINRFKNILFKQYPSKSFYLSAAPQCIVPDAHFATVMKSAWFDFMFIQFYNTPQCSARAAINKAKGTGTADISFDTWHNSAASLNPNVRFYLGLPGAPAAAASGYYLNPAEAQSVIRRFFGRAKFGGVMVWEATYDYTNTVCGRPYGGIMKDILKALASGTSVNTANCGGTIKRRRATLEERREEIKGRMLGQ